MAYGYPTHMPQQGAYPGAYSVGTSISQQPSPGIVQGGGMPPIMQQPVQQVQQVQSNMICRPVAGEAEARSVPADFSGAVTIMPDFAHGRIYTNMLNQNDGTTIFNIFAVQPPAPPVEYAPIGAVQALAAEIEQLKQALAATDKPQKQAKGSAEK